jgi:beta-galactosidase
VNNGGVLVWHPFCGVADEEGSFYPRRLHDGLRELLGADPRDFATCGPEEHLQATWNGRQYRALYYCERLATRAAENRGEYAYPPFNGSPLFTENACGQGKVLYVSAYLEDAFYTDFFSWLCRTEEIPLILEGPVPESVEVAEREAADGTRFVFLLNGSASPVTITLEHKLQDIWAGEWVGGLTTLAPQQVRILRVPSGREGQRVRV